jgi:hypothetical protein
MDVTLDLQSHNWLKNFINGNNSVQLYFYSVQLYMDVTQMAFMLWNATQCGKMTPKAHLKQVRKK